MFAENNAHLNLFEESLFAYDRTLHNMLSKIKLIQVGHKQNLLVFDIY